MSGTRELFIDEAGDLTLFDRRGRLLVGTPGCSSTFIVGVARVEDPSGLADRLRAWREEVLADPRFAHYQSLRPERMRTATLFHAKDDPAPVRRLLFERLAAEPVKVIAAVRRKHRVAERVGALEPLRWRPDSIYDDLVKRILKNELHKAERNIITFARRGKAARQDALRAAILAAQRNFERSHGIESRQPCEVVATTPSLAPGLQAVDYYLWALQRLFERRDDSSFLLVRRNFRLVMDLDDQRNRPYGEWYNDANPLTLEKTAPVSG